MTKPLRIGWLSNAPHIGSGYGTQTRLIIERLKAAGHEPAVFCTHGLDNGIMHTASGIPLLPKGNHFWGQDIVGTYSRAWKADITICFLDAWVMEPWKYGHGVRAVTLFPVDHEPLADNISQTIAGFWDRICYSKSAVKLVNEAGHNCYYVPHGIDTKTFAPGDRAASRETLKLPADAFVVGVVAANHDPMPAPRKNWKNILEGFALFRQNVCPEAILYLHTPLGTLGGVDIRTKVAKLGLQGSVFASDQERLRYGFSDEWMAALYNAFDVLLAPSMGEGFCLPLVEAQACGVPVITSGWSATEELCFSGLLISKDEARRVETGDFVYWYEADAETICTYLAAFYGAKDHYPLWKEVAREKALEYDIDKVFNDFWIPTLGAMAERISEENASVGASLRPKADENYRQALQVAVIEAVTTDPPQVVIVCPSSGEKCGIAEYAKSAARSLVKAGIVPLILPTVEAGCIAALSESVTSLIVLHEYAFFDDMNPRLGRGETTAGMLKALKSVRELKPALSVAIQMHTVTDQNGESPVNTYLARECKESGVRLFATSMQGALYLSAHHKAESDYLPLAAWRITPRRICSDCGNDEWVVYDNWSIGTPGRSTYCKTCHVDSFAAAMRSGDFLNKKDEPFSIANFGMFGAQRDIGAHIGLCKDTDSRFVGSFYCEYAVQAETLHNTLERDGLLDTACLFTDWAEEGEVVRRLSLASCLYMPRPEVGNHYAAASVVTAMSARRPIIINRAGCYEDLWDVLLVADTRYEAIAIVERLKTDPTYYRNAVAKIERYLVERDIATVWKTAGVA